MTTIGLALSGGGARGLVHVGVLQAFLDEGIPVHAISGTSAGAIAGALYAAGHSPQDILRYARESNMIRIFGLKMPNKGLVRHRFLRNLLLRYLPENSFGGLSLPLYVTVANLNSGLPESHSSGPLVDLVVASSSIPILFEPVLLNGNHYLDGGLMKNLPASPLRKTCDLVVGVNLVPQLPVTEGELKSVIDIGTRCFDIAALNNIKPELALCDIVIEPVEISRFSRFSMSQMDKMYEIGYREAMHRIPEIRAKMTASEHHPVR